MRILFSHLNWLVDLSINVIESIKCHIKNKFEFIFIYILDFDCTTILGLPTYNKLNLIKIINIINDSNKNTIDNFNDIFEGLGNLPIKCHIYVDHNVQPIIVATRKIPFSLNNKLSEELNNRYV